MKTNRSIFSAMLVAGVIALSTLTVNVAAGYPLTLHNGVAASDTGKMSKSKMSKMETKKMDKMGKDKMKTDKMPKDKMKKDNN